MSWAVLAASIALVIVTVVYAWHTRAMASEMTATRLLSVQPRITLAVNMRSATVGEIEVVNIGHGPAIEPELTLKIAALEDERRWRAHLLAPGESVGFMLNATDQPHQVVSMQQATDIDAIVELVGTTRDLYGVEHQVADTLDLAHWWREIVDAQQRFREDPKDVANRELKDLREAVEGIHEVLARHLARPEQE